MNDRFQILKSKSFSGMYAVIDAQEYCLIATADDLQEARKIKMDIERQVFQEQIIDEAMENPKILE